MNLLFNYFMADKNLFEALKKDKQTISLTSNAEPVMFCLLFDEQGAYIEVRNQKGNVISPDYLNYSGLVRSILKSVQAITQRNDFLVDWGNQENKVYLHENDFLVEQLLQSKLWIDDNGTDLQAASSVGFVSLVINEMEDEKISSQLQLVINEEVFTDFIFMNEAHI